MFDNLIHNPTSFRDSSSKVKVKVKVKCGKTFPQIFVLSTFSPWQRYFSSFFFNRCSVLHFHLRQLILVAFLWQKTQVGRADIGNKKKKKKESVKCFYRQLKLVKNVNFLVMSYNRSCSTKANRCMIAEYFSSFSSSLQLQKDIKQCMLTTR